MKKRIKVWFNHWFTTAYHIINLIKQDKDIEFYIIGTNENADSIIKLACNEWYQEPVLKDNEYLQYCLDFCKSNLIDVFVPKKQMLLIGKNINLFEQIGTKVMLEHDYDKLYKLNDKEQTYKLFEENNIDITPKRYIVNNVDSFCKAYEKIKKEFEKVCFKFVKDEGAMSFRIIDNSYSQYESLHKYQSVKISFNQIKKILSLKNNFEDIMIMPYLSGDEVSVDCLKTNSGIIIVPRVKSSRRTSEVIYDNRYIDLCNKFYNKIDIQYPCNIQFKYDGDKLFLLEVNTRMSGGIQYSCMATGINIPNLALNQLLGINKSWNINKSYKKISYIETPLIIEGA